MHASFQSEANDEDNIKVPYKFNCTFIESDHIKYVDTFSTYI